MPPAQEMLAKAGMVDACCWRSNVESTYSGASEMLSCVLWKLPTSFAQNIRARSFAGSRYRGLKVLALGPSLSWRFRLCPFN